VKKILIFAGIVISVFTQINGQDSRTLLSGKVSYITAQNIYVKFSTTEQIHTGDTIFLKADNNLVPLFIVENISSVSCVGKPIDKALVKIDDEVVVKVIVKVVSEKQISMISEAESQKPDAIKEKPDSLVKTPIVKRKQDIQGSLSFASYSNMSNLDMADSYRMRYTFSLRANNLADSRFSTESYISFSHQLKKWAEVQQNVFNALKIYSLAVRYDLSEKTNISIGRKVNPRLSNIGAVDGIQAESTIGQFTLGAVAGSRPNDLDYSINLMLLEYGGFVGHTVSTKKGRMQSSVAFFEQRNSGMTDRRFVYFQHDNSLLKKLYFFTSCELDLYKVVEGSPMNQTTLTSLYASIRYKVVKQLSLFASYDARKNVIYYETYKSFVDRLLDEATRQGFQMKIDYRPGNQISMGLSGGYRFRENDRNPNESLNGYFNINQIPWLKMSASLTANLLKTNYLDGNIFGIRLSRDIIPGKLFGELNYRFVDYKFINSDSGLIQNVAQVNLSWQIKNKFSFSLDYELTLEAVNKYHRVYVSLNKRF
jgi:hypothetical protein